MKIPENALDGAREILRRAHMDGMYFDTNLDIFEKALSKAYEDGYNHAVEITLQKESDYYKST